MHIPTHGDYTSKFPLKKRLGTSPRCIHRLLGSNASKNSLSKVWHYGTHADSSAHDSWLQPWQAKVQKPAFFKASQKLHLSEGNTRHKLSQIKLSQENDHHESTSKGASA